MYIKTTYEQEFDDLYMHLKAKYPAKLFDLDGIGKQLDMSAFSRNFFNSTVQADASIDANANCDDVSVIAYNTELPKPFFKLNSYYVLWKELKRLYGLLVANDIIEKQLTGDIYIHDMHGIGAGSPYCYNYSTYDIMTRGLPMVKKVRSLPPKYLYSFKSQLEQFTVIASNSTLGATGLADLLVIMSYYVKNILATRSDAHFHFATEADCWAYIEENLVSFIYTVNQPMRANQSPFTNVSVYDDYFLDKICDDYVFPDMSSPDKTIIKRLQGMFLDIMNTELRRTSLTFPVTTACFSIDADHNIRDEEFLSFIAEKNREYGFINIYCGDSSTLSSCCFDGSQKVLIRSTGDEKRVKLVPISDLINDDYSEFRRNLTVFHNGSWGKASPVKIKHGNRLYKVITANKKELLVTADHLHLTDRGDVVTSDLTTDHFLAFNTRALSAIPEQDLNLSYEQGYAIGMYLGDGSKYRRSDSDSYSVTFSLSASKKNCISMLEKGLVDWGIAEKLHLNEAKNNVLSVSIYSKNFFNIIDEWVLGDYSYEKNINLNCLEQSEAFRQGIVDGWYGTDGGNSNRIYTTSTGLIESAEAIFTSLGINTVIDLSDRTGDGQVVIRGESFNRNHPLYCIRWYDMGNKRSMGDVYRVQNNTEFFRIVDIQPIEATEDHVYCFEMKAHEPYFTLPNGVVTHNCRLRSEQKSEYFNSFGSGSSKIGSLGVCSINFPRLAIKYPDEKAFMIELTKMVEVCARINNAKRHIIEKRIKNGNEPLYSLGFMELSKQYSTVGVNGFNECIELMGHDLLDESGQELAISILEAINAANARFQRQYNAPHNCEQVPGENMSIKMADKDKLLGYQDQYDIYSNQFIPLVASANLLDRIKLQGMFDSHFSGGSILHLNVDTRIEDVEDIKTLIRETAKKHVVYFAINYVLCECVEGHMSVGNDMVCPVCGKEITGVYTRVVGFLTNVKNWHKTRREQDFPCREFYQGVKIEPMQELS